jgi:HSP20 family protein
LSLTGNMLTVSFESQQEKTEENKPEEWIRKEFRKQSFSRSFTLDESVAAEKISARYENGILYLSLPKNEKALSLSRTISVE